MAIEIKFENNSYTFNTPEDLRNFAHSFAVAYKGAAEAAMFDVAKFYAENHLEVTPSEFAKAAGVCLNKATRTCRFCDPHPNKGIVYGRDRYKARKSYFTVNCDESGNPLVGAQPVRHVKTRVVYRFKQLY